MARAAEADPRSLPHVELLQREMDLLWGDDLYGREQRPHPIVAVAVANEGVSVRLHPSVPESFVLPLLEHLRGSDPVENPTLPTGLLEFISALGETRWRGGPSYVFHDSFAKSSERRILTSAARLTAGIAPKCSQPWWEPTEWTDLVSGRLGPWALGLEENEVVAICHTPVASAIATEAGVWTHPDHRGKGWAALVTAAWAEVARSSFETLFYSTDFGNLASQAIARKLQLERIGTVWQLEKT